VAGTQAIAGLSEWLLQRAGEGGRNLIQLIGITQYMQARSDAAIAEYFQDYIMLVQAPGLPADGPITAGFLNMSRTDSSGEPISLVGYELAALVAQRTVNVSFIDIGGGASPWKGRIVIDDLYLAPDEMETPFGSGLLAHELTHDLHRELNDPVYFPSGGPRLSHPARGVVGDSTNYMEVMAYIVGETVEYDLLSEKEQTIGLVPFEQVRMRAIENDLATFTDPDAWNATRYVVKSHPGAAVYERNYVVELGVGDHRIPQGSWDRWLMEIGLSGDAVDHIRSIAARGTAEYIDPAMIDAKSGAYITPTPTSVVSPTPSATPTPPATPTPTATPAATITAQGMPSPTQSTTPRPRE